MANTGTNILSNLNKNFKKAKAEQILRLLRDQESLNEKFREFSLESDDSDAKTDDETGNLTDSDESIHETERKLAERISLRRHSGVRCKTSMGFHNDTENDGDVGLQSRDSSLTLRRPIRITNSNPRRRMYTPRPDGREFSLDIGGDAVDNEEQLIESARSARSGVGAPCIRQGLSLSHQHTVPMDTCFNDFHDRPRHRLSSAKIDPLCRSSPIKGFCDNMDVLDSRQEDLPCNSYYSLPPRSYTPQTFTPIGAPNVDHHRFLNRSLTVVDRSVRPGSYVSQSRIFSQAEGSSHSRGDYRVLTSCRPRRKLPDISKAKSLTVMKLPPLESKKTVNNRELLCLSKEPCTSDIRC